MSALSADVGAIRLPEEPRGRAATESITPPSLRAPAGAAPSDALLLPGRDTAADVPPGADPQAWLGLSVEERSYFDRLAVEGRLSYGPVDRAGEAPLYRGRHLSIRV